jgi:excinuclease UvrABC nuclease subunit
MAEQTLYRFFDADGQLLYIGISINAYQRFKSHMQTQTWIDEVANITLQSYPTRAEVEQAEIEAIRAESPKYNRIRYKTNEREPIEDMVQRLADDMSQLTAVEIANAFKGAMTGYMQLKGIGKDNG